MRRAASLALLVVVAGAPACDGPARAPSEGTREVRFGDLLGAPASFDGVRVRLTGHWLRSADRAVLARGLTEEIPPEPEGATIWMDVEPDDECLFTDAGATWGRVVAEGIFRYEEGGGFGPFRVYPMAFEDAELTCP